MSTARELRVALLASATQPLSVVATPGAQVATARPVVIQVNDLNGEAVASAVRCIACFRKADASIATTEATLAETGAGAGVSTTAKPTLIFDTDATGAATVTVTNASGGALPGYFEVQPLNQVGEFALVACDLT